MKEEPRNFWKDKNLTAEEKNELLIETCGRVFSSEDGKIVLNMLLSDLGVFNANGADADAPALNSYGKFFIRERLGVRDTKSLTDFIADTAASGGR